MRIEFWTEVSEKAFDDIEEDCSTIMDAALARLLGRELMAQGKATTTDERINGTVVRTLVFDFDVL